jgi:hypothetical protein
VTTKVKRINFANDFTDTPGGRLKIHGPFSGEEFREDHLKKALAEYDEVILDLNGAFGFPASFIDEAFGILVKDLGLEHVRSKLKIILDDDSVARREIDECMHAHCA